MQIGESYFYKGLDDENILILKDPLDAQILDQIKKYKDLRIVVRNYSPWAEFDTSEVEENVSEICLEDAEAPNEVALNFRHVVSLHLCTEPGEGFFSSFSKLAKCTLGGVRKLPKDLAENKSLRTLHLLDDCRLPKGKLFEGFLNLEKLYLSAKSLPRGFSNFEDLNNLCFLSLSDWKGEDLSLIQELKSLESIRVDYANKVIDLDGFAACRDLHTIHLAAMKSLSNLDVLASLKELRSITLEDCPSVESLSPLFAHQELRNVRLWGKTKVQDGDIRGLLTCPELRALEFNNRKGYNLKFEELK